jgi:hypothetical protein
MGAFQQLAGHLSNRMTGRKAGPAPRHSKSLRQVTGHSGREDPHELTAHEEPSNGTPARQAGLKSKTGTEKSARKLKPGLY